jgi:hypothetical protein
MLSLKKEAPPQTGAAAASNVQWSHNWAMRRKAGDQRAWVSRMVNAGHGSLHTKQLLT